MSKNTDNTSTETSQEWKPGDRFTVLNCGTYYPAGVNVGGEYVVSDVTNVDVDPRIWFMDDRGQRRAWLLREVSIARAAPKHEWKVGDLFRYVGAVQRRGVYFGVSYDITEIRPRGVAFTDDSGETNFAQFGDIASIVTPVEPLTPAVSLHGGYVGVTREGKRVEVLGSSESIEWQWLADNDSLYDSAGNYATEGYTHPRDIIGPWAGPAVLTPGVWYPHTGDECPVDCSAMVEVILRHDVERGAVGDAFRAGEIADWRSTGAAGDIMLFRIVAAAEGQEAERLMWIDEDTNEVYETRFKPSLVPYRRVTE